MVKKIEQVEFKDQSQMGPKPNQIREIKLVPSPLTKKSKYDFSFKSFLIFSILIFLTLSIIDSIAYSMAPKVAIININGVIREGDSLDSNVFTPNQFSNYYDQIFDDKTYKAIILRINSPGGTPTATSHISNLIEKLKDKNVPIITYIDNIGTSGAYWIATYSDRIYSNPYAIVGSIGVKSEAFGFEEFIEEYNISYRTYTSGEFKDFLSPFKKPSEKEEEMIQNILDSLYADFKIVVKENRNLTEEEFEEISDGRIFLAKDSIDNKLIDEIIYFEDLKEIIENQTGEKEPIYVPFQTPKTFFEEIGLKSFDVNFKAQNSNLIIE